MQSLGDDSVELGIMSNAGTTVKFSMSGESDGSSAEDAWQATSKQQLKSGPRHHEEVIEKQWLRTQLPPGLTAQPAMQDQQSSSNKHAMQITRSISNTTDISQQSVEVDGARDDEEEDDDDISDGDCNVYGRFDTLGSERLVRHISECVAACLRHGTKHLAHLLLLPDHLLLRAGEDVLRLSESEPCGLRGCQLIVQYEGTCLGSLRVHPDTPTPPTHELVLTLHRDNTKHWWHLLRALPFPHSVGAAATGSHVMLSAGFTLVKCRLYRT